MWCGCSRQLAPLLVGGATVCCGGFDPNLFWDLVCGPAGEDSNGSDGGSDTAAGAAADASSSSPVVTWYYAAPTMHQMILRGAPAAETQRAPRGVRMIANAAGNLTHELAVALQSAFRGAVVLPSCAFESRWCARVGRRSPSHALQTLPRSGALARLALCAMELPELSV